MDGVGIDFREVIDLTDVAVQDASVVDGHHVVREHDVVGGDLVAPIPRIRRVGEVRVLDEVERPRDVVGSDLPCVRQVPDHMVRPVAGGERAIDVVNNDELEGRGENVRVQALRRLTGQPDPKRPRCRLRPARQQDVRGRGEDRHYDNRD